MPLLCTPACLPQHPCAAHAQVPPCCCRCRCCCFRRYVPYEELPDEAIPFAGRPDVGCRAPSNLSVRGASSQLCNPPLLPQHC